MYIPFSYIANAFKYHISVKGAQTAQKSRLALEGFLIFS